MIASPFVVLIAYRQRLEQAGDFALRVSPPDET
jgi:hypothetical protein